MWLLILLLPVVLLILVVITVSQLIPRYLPRGLELPAGLSLRHDGLSGRILLVWHPTADLAHFEGQ
jgi:uncharacterized integral membrane protein